MFGTLWFVSLKASILGERREAIREAAARHGAERIALFGSVVRGEDGAESDCDFLVDFGTKGSLTALVGLKADLEEMLGRDADVVSMGGLTVKHRALVEDAVVL